jgi:alpha-glucosidase
MTHPLHLPHHDGSPTYLSDESPALGDTVTVRVRTHEASMPDAMWLRTTYDAEPVYHACTREGDWWTAELLVHNPLTHYRFLLAHADWQVWLTAAGIITHDGPDAFDFLVSATPAPPGWGRDAVIYEIFPDRFARSAAAADRPAPSWAIPEEWDAEVHFHLDDPHTSLQLFGGDLDGIVDRLDHVASLGATTVYLTPVFPAESNHRYNASSFDRIDPVLGGDEAYARLLAALHDRGLRLLGDLTANHTGDTHEWFVEARAGGPTRDWYFFHPDGSYECWMGYSSLPKLDHTHADLRAALVEGPDSVVAHWLRPPFEVDGWRIDVANMTGRLAAVDVNHRVQHAVRRTAWAERPDPLVIGEHNHDASADLNVGGWDGTMNYSGFSWPVWSWLREPASPALSFGRPVPVSRRTGPEVARTMDEWWARYGWRASTTSWSILGSHDSARIRTVVGSGELQRVAAGLLFTLPGVPMVFAGDELGLEGITGEDARKTMPWDRPEEWDRETLAAYRSLAALRHDHVALRRGGFRWAHVDDDTLAFLREHLDESLLVVARRAPGPSFALPLREFDVTSLYGALGDLSMHGDVLVIPDGEAGIDVWALAILGR